MLKSFYQAFLKTRLKDVFIILTLLVVGSIPRLSELGYSHFYGDEVKTLYLDKTIPAYRFLLDQRKGPVQFVLVWIVEKLSGGFEEGLVRLPFALFGVLTIPVFYLVTKKLFGSKASVISSLLFTLNGFFIAFSRTAQYQSPLLFFGFLSLLIILHMTHKNRKCFLVLASLSISTAFMCHYDAVFFLIPLLYFLHQKFRELKMSKIMILYFALPLFSVLSLFYVPYLLGGYMQRNTIGYIGRRMAGDYGSSRRNFSPYTIFTYNPFTVYAWMLLFSIPSLFDNTKKIYLVWFFVPFVLFQFFFSSPGTHILHYLIPLIILAGLGISEIKGKVGEFVFAGVIVVSVIQFTVCMRTYVPRYGVGYPWNTKVNPSYQLFLYGFPYYRGWDQVADYMYENSNARAFYTNDNSIVAGYYLRRLDVTPIGNNFLPQYYIKVKYPQSLSNINDNFLKDYELEKQFEHIEVYKLKGI